MRELVGATALLTGALARSCHPAPTLAVTVFVTLLGRTAGTDLPTTVLLALAVLSGQLSIGWSNDRLDVHRDRLVERTDKPLAVREITTRTAEVAIAAAVAATIGFSLALGWRAGLLHLAAVACGWAYNLKIKATWWSWLPYAAAFGALPGVATLALPTHPAPAAWAVAAGALLGVTANLTNPLPELADDAATGVRGLPHRLGARPALLLGTGLLLVSSVLIVLGPPGPPEPLAWAGLAVDTVAALVGLGYAWPRPATKSAFYGIIGVVAVDVVLIATTGHALR